MGSKNSKKQIQEQQPFNEANQIIVETHKNKNDKTIYLPVYLITIVKNFKEVKFDELNSQINTTLVINIGVGGLPEDLIYYLKDNIIIFLSRDGGMRLSENKQNPEVTMKQTKKEDQKYLTFTVRKAINAKIQPYIFFTPYEIIDQVFTIEFRKLQVPTQKHGLTIKFNLMDTNIEDLRFKCYNNCAFGNYDIANNRHAIEFTSENTPKTLMQLGKSMYRCQILDQKRQQYFVDETKKDQAKDRYCQYCHIHVPLYRYPIVALSTIFVPLWLLGIINLAIFYQDPGLADRVASIATLMIAFVGLIPILRDQLPPNPKVTILQILIYCQIATTFLCLVQSLQVRNQDQTQFMNSFQPYRSPEYLISLIITMLIVIIPIVSHIIHLTVLRPSHKSPRIPTNTTAKQIFKQWNANQHAKQWLSQQPPESVALKTEHSVFKELMEKIGSDLKIDKKNDL